MPVRVVTDSTADLPPELAQELGITVVPLNVHFGEETFLDGVTLTADEFYRKLVASPRLPTTSQPSVGTFLQVYQSILPGSEGVVSIHISSRISGTYNAATQAKGELGEGQPVEVVDTLQASLGLGLVVLAAARAARRGASLPQVLEETRQAIGQVSFFGVLDTLEYLEKGGRIGRAQAFLGSLLSIKPILTIKDGEAHPLTRVRTRARALAHLEELVRQAMPLQELGVIHATTPDEAQTLADRLRECAPQRRVIISRFGPVVGTYLGPGSLGIALRRAG